MNKTTRPRKSITDFAKIMEAQLRANDDYKGRRGWVHLTEKSLLNRILNEWLELRDEIVRQPHLCPETRVKRICNECADVANFAMMIADNFS